MSWSPDGELLASCSSDRTVRIWQERRAGGWAEVSRLEDAHERTVRCCEWSPCGRFVAAVSFDATCTVWRKSATEGPSLEWDILATLEGHENEVKGCAWNASTTILATCGRDKTVWLWETIDDEALELLSVLHGHQGDVKAVVFDPSPQATDLLASAAYDDVVKIWVEDGDDWIERASLLGHSSTVWDCRFVPGGDPRRKTIATCGADRAVLLWRQASDDAATWVLAGRLDDVHSRPVYSLDAREGLVATAGGDDALRLFQVDVALASLAPLAVLNRAHDADVNCVRFNPARPTLLATAADDAAIKVWRRV